MVHFISVMKYLVGLMLMVRMLSLALFTPGFNPLGARVFFLKHSILTS